MLICYDRWTGAGCRAENRDNAQFCNHCGRSLRQALRLWDRGAVIRNYRITGVLGHGGFGAVYQAEDLLQPGARVALKETFDSETIRGFQNEFSILSRLQHPHLPRYYAAFEELGNGYLVMELVPGQTLEDVLAKHGAPLLEGLVLGYAIQICDALTYLHEQTPPIIHRDIKPANIRLTPEGLIMLVDFGLLKQGSGPTQTPQRGLTPSYAPLEQWRGGTDVRTDLYSLGATLYHLLTGQLPAMATDRAVAAVDLLIPPDGLNPRLSTCVADALTTALALQPDGRHASAAAFKLALLNLPTSSAGAQARETLVVSASGDGQHQTISAAVLAATPGARILVRPGVYRESVIIDKAVEIVGDGPAGAMVVEAAGGNCLTVATPGAVVRGLTLRQQNGAAGQEYFGVEIVQGPFRMEECDITSDSRSCIAIHGQSAHPIIRRCTIHDGQRAGVAVYEKARAVIEDCDILANAGPGVQISEGGAPTVRRCRIHHEKVGVFVHTNGHGVIEDCDIFANALFGVAVREGGAPTVRRCRIHDGQSAGVAVWQNGQGVIEDCDIFANMDSGIEISEGGAPTVRRCTIHDGKLVGVFIHTNGLGVIEDCDIFANALSGVQIRDGSAPTVRRCTIHDGKQVGVFVHSDGQGVIEDCDIFANMGSGIEISKGGAPTVRRCTIHDGKLVGVFIHTNGLGVIEDCDIFANALDGVAITEGGVPIVRRCRIMRNAQKAVHAFNKAGGRIEGCDVRGNKRGAWAISRDSRVDRVGNQE